MKKPFPIRKGFFIVEIELIMHLTVRIVQLLLLIMRNIDIVSPCSENWNEMSATEKGAFCQKCAIDVHDFTNKSSFEIKKTLKESASGHVCGRIKKGQLDNLEMEFQTWKMTTSRRHRTAFIFSLIVVFGLTLFSCSNQKEADAIRSIQNVASNVVLDVPEEVKLNPIEFLEEVVEVEARVVEEIQFVDQVDLGRMSMEVEIDPYEILESETMVLGGFGYSTQYIDHLERIEPVESIEKIELDENGIPYPTEFSSLVYPNPASTSANLKFEAPEDFNGRIEVYDMSGRMVLNLISGPIRRGTHDLEMNLIDLMPGSYIVAIFSEQYKESFKFIKQ
jgi:hypothetical protein